METKAQYRRDGAYSPTPVVTHKIHERIMAEVIRPTVAGLQADGIRYRGFLAAGLMITDEGEAQVLNLIAASATRRRNPY